MPKKEKNAICRAKIDHMNYIKWHVKYTWVQSQLLNESNAPINKP